MPASANAREGLNVVSPAAGWRRAADYNEEALAPFAPDSSCPMTRCRVLTPDSLQIAKCAVPDTPFISSPARSARIAPSIAERAPSIMFLKEAERALVPAGYRPRAARKPMTAVPGAWAKRELAESEERSVLCHAFFIFGMALVRLMGRWLGINPACATIVGYGEERICFAPISMSIQLIRTTGTPTAIRCANCSPCDRDISDNSAIPKRRSVVWLTERLAVSGWQSGEPHYFSPYQIRHHRTVMQSALARQRREISLHCRGHQNGSGKSTRRPLIPFAVRRGGNLG